MHEDHQPDLPQTEPATSSDPLPAYEGELASTQPKPQARRGVAPLWHTLLLIAAILGFSYWGADRGNPVDIDPIAPVPASAHSDSSSKATAKPTTDEEPAKTSSTRLIRYGLSGVVELVLVAWIAFGLYLRKLPFSSLLGTLPRDLNSLTIEIGVAALFWLCSMVILSCIALGWNAVQQRIYEHGLKVQSTAQLTDHAKGHADHQSGDKAGATSAQPSSKKDHLESPKQEQARMIRKLMELAPATGIEMAAWAFLCLLVGFSEEIIFRGYLQTQAVTMLRSIPIGVIVSALIFGAAHGYQGPRGMFLITIYGALFGVVALLRRNLIPGMTAHSWHDFFTGMMLALVRSTHLLDKLQSS